MPIDYLEGGVLYENLRPHVRSRHGYFPGLALLDSGELIALFVIAEAFEAADATTWAARSRDRGGDRLLTILGQPSLLRLNEDEFLAAHWAIEDGQGKIKTHRLRVRA
jgi:hypothetical protein